MNVCAKNYVGIDVCMYLQIYAGINVGINVDICVCKYIRVYIVYGMLVLDPYV